MYIGFMAIIKNRLLDAGCLLRSFALTNNRSKTGFKRDFLVYVSYPHKLSYGIARKKQTSKQNFLAYLRNYDNPRRYRIYIFQRNFLIYRFPGLARGPASG